MGDTSRSQTVSTKLQQIAKQAEDYPEMVFTTLAHHIDVDFLREAYRHTRKDSSPGVDGITAKQYGEHLEENLQDLYDRLKNGRYEAPPVLRAWLEKDNGKKRPIGKPTFEDKIVQRAVVMLLEPIYEQVFHEFSHGFRKGRSQHRAIKELRENLIDLRINWIVIADITGLFDNLDHEILRNLIKKRMNDGTLLRLIGKWLNAGVMEGDSVHHPEQGTPQGGVISPLLSNVYLNEVDKMLERAKEVTRNGRFSYIEYARWADDLVVLVDGFRKWEWLLKAAYKRLEEEFEKLDVQMNQEKTRIVDLSRDETFSFLGFDYRRVKTRRGVWGVRVTPRMKARTALLRELKEVFRRHQSQPVDRIIYLINPILRGWVNYFRIGHSSKCFGYVKDWVEKKIRRHLMHARKRPGFGWNCKTRT